MIELRQLQFEDAREMAQLYRANRQYLQPFEPIRDDTFYTVYCQEEMITAALDDPQYYLLGIILNGAIIGRISLGATGGFFQNGRFGYWIAQSHGKRGYMTAAVKLAIRFAFEDLSLHRLEANVMPRNIPSLRILEKCGFERIGLARRYLMINGKWEDHYLHQLLNPAQE